LEEPPDDDTDDGVLDSENIEQPTLSDLEDSEEDEWGGIADPAPSIPSPASSSTLLDQQEPEPRSVRFALPDSSPAKPTEPATKYIPPHLRAKATPLPTPTTPEIDPRLNRLLSGQLNKLSPTNIAVILGQIESLYTQHPRALMTSALTTLVVERVAGSTDVLGEINVLTFAALVSSFYGKGIGLRESVITECLSRWDKRSEDQGKERNNIVRLWSRLYNLDVLGCPMIYGVIRELIEGQVEGQQLAEEDVEALLIIMKSRSILFCA